jgi:membrane-associated phospholipid phosphatase
VGVAGTVALLRVVAGKHFPTDVLAGALLGVAGGAAVHAIKF